MKQQPIILTIILLFLIGSLIFVSIYKPKNREQNETYCDIEDEVLQRTIKLPNLKKSPLIVPLVDDFNFRFIKTYILLEYYDDILYEATNYGISPPTQSHIDEIIELWDFSGYDYIDTTYEEDDKYYYIRLDFSHRYVAPIIIFAKNGSNSSLIYTDDDLAWMAKIIWYEHGQCGLSNYELYLTASVIVNRAKSWYGGSIASACRNYGSPTVWYSYPSNMESRVWDAVYKALSNPDPNVYYANGWGSPSGNNYYADYSAAACADGYPEFWY